MPPFLANRSFERSNKLRRDCTIWFPAVRTLIRAAQIDIRNT